VVNSHIYMTLEIEIYNSRLSKMRGEHKVVILSPFAKNHNREIEGGSEEHFASEGFHSRQSEGRRYPERKLEGDLSPIERFAYGFLRYLGASLLGFVFLYMFFIYQPVLTDEINYYAKSGNNIETQSVVPDPIYAQEREKIKEEAESYGISSSFSIGIPKIQAYSNILPNIDPANSDEYISALSKGVAHARGTYFPGQGKGIYLFSHSTNSPLSVARYNAVFYLLDKLEANDRIILYFSDNKYIYEVTERYITPASDTSYLTNNYNKETLILQTCNPPGTTWKRLIIIAKPVDK